MVYPRIRKSFLRKYVLERIESVSYNLPYYFSKSVK